MQVCYKRVTMRISVRVTPYRSPPQLHNTTLPSVYAEAPTTIPAHLTPESSNERTVLRSSEHMLLSGALVVRLSQADSELELGLKPHTKPSFVPLVSLQPELCAVPRGH